MSLFLVTMQAKKNKKKSKSEVKATQDVDGKEPDEGLKLIWLTNLNRATKHTNI